MPCVIDTGGMPRSICGGHKSMVVYCSPRDAQHDVRMKVSPIRGDRMIEDQAITIAVRPEPHYPSDEQRRLPQADFDSVAAWVQRTPDVLVVYWNVQIDTDEFRRRVAERLTDT